MTTATTTEVKPEVKETKNRIEKIVAPTWREMSTKIEHSSKAQEAMKEAGLDYEVGSKGLFVWADRAGGKSLPIGEKVATYRKDTGEPLGVVGESYKIIQNKDAFSFFDTIIENRQADYTSAGTFDGGRRVFLQAKLPKDIIIKGDVVEKYLLIVNSHNGSTPLKMLWTPIRVVCQNTLAMAMRGGESEFVIRHSGNVVNKISLANESLLNAMKYFNHFELVATSLADRMMTEAEVKKYFNLVAFKNEGKETDSTQLKNKRDLLFTLFERGKGQEQKAIRHTAWAAYNAVTEYVDHHHTVKNSKDNPNKRLENIWLGSGALAKREAFDDIIKVTGLN